MALADVLPAAECADEGLPLISNAYADRVRDTIQRLTLRAAQGEEFATKALVIWRREWGRIERGELY